MSTFPFEPPTGWAPSSFVDETAPPLRATPDAWIVQRGAGTVTLAGPNEKRTPSDTTGRVVVSAHEVVSFDACFVFGTIEVDIYPDGTWTSRQPVPSAATVFWESGEPDTINFTMDAFAREAAENADFEGEPSVCVTVTCIHWVDGIRFILGRPRGMSILSFIPVQSVGARISERAEA